MSARDIVWAMLQRAKHNRENHTEIMAQCSEYCALADRIITADHETKKEKRQ